MSVREDLIKAVEQAPDDLVEEVFSGESLLEMIDRITADMIPEEIAQLPTDGAEQHNHYIYGTPKDLHETIG